jgi:hypothetical protein
MSRSFRLLDTQAGAYKMGLPPVTATRAPDT